MLPSGASHAWESDPFHLPQHSFRSSDHNKLLSPKELACGWKHQFQLGSVK